ncbi:hypothetical protein Ahy_B01g057003 [Arachis hypogaea]|uniref:Myb/SANT-like domain-containing protein n=1 Tax=Arachis hypogaea TaxID=3818 RepID=A0A445B008_ARAHY|nr:hypothetical protein Ahy_B01g057003 [Arachis hypogaea]
MASIPRQWTEQETEQFVVFMEELVVESKRVDAGQFKPGAFQKLADKMNEKFPGCGLTGRNVTLYTLDKPFPLFERLRNIFGKDRATGGDDVDMEDLAAVEGELSNNFLTSFASSSEKNQERHTTTKKSNDAAVLSNLAETFKAVVEDQGKHVQVLANAMSGVNEQVNLGRTLKSLGFNTMEIVQIAKKFVQNPELKATFWSLDEEKEAFARDIMDNFYWNASFISRANASFSSSKLQKVVFNYGFSTIFFAICTISIVLKPRLFSVRPRSTCSLIPDIALASTCTCFP